MSKLKKSKLATKIFFEFITSEYYHGEETMEEDLKLFIENNEKYKDEIEELKKGK